MKKEYYYQVVNVKYPSGTPVGTLHKEVSLSNAYDHCVGVAFYPIATSGANDFFRVGIADNSQDYVQNIPFKALMSDPTAGLQQANRFAPLLITGRGHVVKVRTEFTAAITAVVEYDLIFLMERDRKCS
ncbi:hypothetical protein [Algivirga pacifica]|uniref:Uncharacterized protein n=1 Tax=Algivirga pacifica TaxID=1162670 RepID=A0ABP9DPU9_9BACT